MFCGKKYGILVKIPPKMGFHFTILHHEFKFHFDQITPPIGGFHQKIAYFVLITQKIDGISSSIIKNNTKQVLFSQKITNKYYLLLVVGQQITKNICLLTKNIIKYEQSI